jgi:hypothetical protein
VADIADLDGDGRLDLVLHLRVFTGMAAFFVNRLDLEPQGAPFAFLSELGLGDVQRLAVADLDLDGRPDLIASRETAIEVRLATGPGTFANPRSHDLGDCTPFTMLGGDLDGDGDVDLAAGCGWFDILLNRGTGILDRGASTTGVPATLEALGDLDGDQDLDLIGIRHGFPAANDALIAWNQGGGRFEETVAFPLPSSVRSLAATDIDGDGDLDLAAGTDRLLVLFRNDGRGSFVEYETYTDVYEPRFGDLDGDPFADLVTGYGEQIGLRWNQGDGSFAPSRNVPLSGHIAAARIADVDGDGLGDVVTSPALSSHAVASVVFSRRRSASLDCDGNGIPDECAPAPDLDCRAYTLPHECTGDCDFDGRSDACEIAAGEVPDCDGNGVPDTCEVPGVSAADCDGNGVFDYCQPEIDCNRDGIGEACQELYDGDRNGVPDDCEDRDISFQVTFQALEVVRVGAAPARVEATVFLEQHGLIAGEQGASGWTLFAKAEGCDLVEATHGGTDAQELSSSGFLATEVTRCRCPGGYTGAITAVFLDLDQIVTLPPGEGPQSILKVVLEGSPGADGACAPCTLGLVEVDDCNQCHRGEPYQNLVSYRQKTYPVSFRPGTLHFCTAEFHRGDANADGWLDITDPIVIFDHLFLGGTRPACLEAADAQNDGRIELTDGIRLLEFLFRDGPPPAAPGGPREPCGPDPEEPPGHFGCEEYAGC